jgi:HPt (histidine-containing phosphotransfer) domain-containing protein
LYPSQEVFFKGLPLLDFERLTTSRSNFKDKFHEFLQSMISNLRSRDKELQIGFEHKNQQAILETLHSFIGAAGYVGAYALHQYIKVRLYPAVYAGEFPEEEAWVETVHALVEKSIDALQKDWVEKQEDSNAHFKL